MILSIRKSSFVFALLTLTDCFNFNVAQEKFIDPCTNKSVIRVQDKYGQIESRDAKLHGSLNCQLWSIQGELNDIITVRISFAAFDEEICGAGSNLILGPLPYLDICQRRTEDFPVMYRSKRDHMWIKYIIGSKKENRLLPYQFALEYITNSSKSCRYWCVVDHLCIPEDWICNGKAECKYGDDEFNCNKTTAFYRKLLKTSTTTRAPATQDSSCFRCFVTLYAKNLCLPSEFLCDGVPNCHNSLDENKIICDRYKPATTQKPQSTTCGYREIYCYVKEYRQYRCLHNMYRCDGIRHCANGADENPVMCGDSVCNRRLEEPVGWFASPNFPDSYPQHASCSWVIHKRASGASSIIQLRVVAFYLENEPDTDYVKVYDGPDSTYKLIGSYYGLNSPPYLIESSSNWLNVVFHSDYFEEDRGFNFTYQIKGECLPTQIACEGELNCYHAIDDRCDGIWDCPLKGSDELGCGNCKDDYSCGLKTSQCYYPMERCNGLARCSNSFDEMNCTSDLCGSHNGTFLCDNRRCIYESWTCDERDDCGDNSDEQFCTGTTKRVIIAAICGSMICALLLVILLGCSCKLYSLRTMDHHHRYPRHETPMSRLYAEFLRRRAPPPYHEAMLTSRNFDEVQQEYLDRMRNSRRSHRGRGSRRRSRNQQSQSPSDSGGMEENQTITNNGNNGNVHEGATGMQLSTINEENENHVNIDRTSSSAELLPSESDIESESDDDESETDLAEQGEGHSNGHILTNTQDNRDEGDDDDDVENILASTSLSAQWMRTADDDDSSDDVCILGNSSQCENMTSDRRVQSHCDNISIDTEATASIASIEHQEIRNDDTLFKDSDSENESDCDRDTLENSRNSTPKPDNNHGNTVISENNHEFMRRANSQGSLSSEGSETYSENDVPLLPMNSVVTQHF